MKPVDLDIDAITVESPCSVPWSSMTGDDVRRYCRHCRLHVVDLSRMTRAEIRRLHAETGGAFCKRIWRRPDGRVITRDCRPLVEATRRRLRAIGTAAAGLLALLGLAGCGSRSSPSEGTGTEPGRAAPPASAPGEAPPPPAEEPPEPDATVITGR